MEYGSWREGDEEGLRLEKRNIACKIEQKVQRRPQRRRAHVDGGSAAGVFLDRCRRAAERVEGRAGRRAAALPSALGAAIVAALPSAPRAVPRRRAAERVEGRAGRCPRVVYLLRGSCDKRLRCGGARLALRYHGRYEETCHHRRRRGGARGRC